MSINMSYCRCENTFLALNEVLENMRDQGPEFVKELSREERRAFQSLFNACEDFIDLSQEFEDGLEFGDKE